MIYLDNAATSFPKPKEVGPAMSTYIAHFAGNPGRSSHHIAASSQNMLDRARKKLTNLIGGDDPNRLIFTLNATDALNMAIKGVVWGRKRHKDILHVVTTITEHNSVSRPLKSLERAGDINLTQVNCDDTGIVNPWDIKAALTKDTALVVMAHGSNVTGAVQDAAGVGKIAREHGALFLLDAAQTIGTVPVDIKKMNVDLLAFPGHKALGGPTGTGGLYVGRCAVSEPGGTVGFYPWRQGGTGGDSQNAFQPTEFPFFLEAGTANTVGIAGLGAAIEGLTHDVITQRQGHEQNLASVLIRWLKEDKRFNVYGPDGHQARVGVVAFNLIGMASQDVAAILDDSFDIAVRAGLHCAPYIHQRLGTFPDGCVRASFGAYNSADDVAALVKALEQIAQAV